MSTPSPTDRELEALKVLWRDREATVRQIWGVLTVADPDLAYTTVLSLLQVMQQKGLVRHRAEGKAYIYSAAVERQGVFRRLAGGFLERVFDGAMDEYLVHALDARRPTDAELARLEEMIAAAKKRGTKKRPKGKRR